MLTFVGLGLYDLRDVSLRGMDRIRQADYVFLESYTSLLSGCTIDDLERFYGKPVRVLSREDVEVDPGTILDLAAECNVVLLTGGDPMVSTTHIDLRMRACRQAIPTAIIHGTSISTAICGLSGLQNYRFGRACTVPFPHKGWAPETPIDVIAGNLARDLHTLVYLDITPDRCMTAGEGIGILSGLAEKKNVQIPLYVGIARAGSERPVVAAGTAGKLMSVNFGPPLHILVVPASLHIMEKEYLELFAGYDPTEVQEYA